ncbi:MAG: topoisomerase I protein, partial [Candidatus Azambacteria bacterium GW2011_GWA1_42_19]
MEKSRPRTFGRVQSVAVRLVVEREREVLSFKPQEFHTILAKFLKNTFEFSAQLIKIGKDKLEKFSIMTDAEAQKIVADLKNSDWNVESIIKKEMRRQPLAPFTTSTLQQTAFSKFGFGAKQTMVIAQQLYETGFITYMRTDS